MQNFLDFHSHFREFSADENAIVSLFPSENPCENRKNILYSCGIHPKFLGKNDPDCKNSLEIIRERMQCAIFAAVGECGLDRSAALDISKQIELFEKQIEIACEFRKALIIHCVRAYSEILSIRKNLSESNIPFIIHGFQGSAKLAEQLSQKNIILSFGYRAIREKKHMESIFAVKDKGFFLESDTASEGVKPLYVAVSDILKIDIDELKAKIWKFAENFIHFPD